MDIIACVMNEQRMAKRFFDRYKKNKDINIINSIEDKGGLTSLDKIFCAWKETIQDSSIDFIIKNENLDENKINVIFIPYSGLAYLVMKDKFLNNNVNHYCIAIFQEKIVTKVRTNELFNLYISNRFNPTFGIFKEFFSNITGNELIDDPIYYNFFSKELKENKVTNLSENINQYIIMTAN